LAWLRVLGAVMLLTFYTLLSWRIGVYAGRLMDRDSVTLFLNLPQGPVMAVVSGFLAVCAAVQLLVVFVAVRCALAGFPDPASWSLGQEDEEAPPPPPTVPLGRVVVTTLAILAAAALVLSGIYFAVDVLTPVVKASPGTFVLAMLLALWV